MKFKTSLAAAAAVVLYASAAQAAWPTAPVTIVVPFAPGQTGDIIARLIGKELQAKFGQAFVIDNRAGSGGRIGTAYVARARADGYTLLLTSTGPYAIAPALYPRDTKYDPLADFTGVAEAASTPQVMAVSNQSGINSMADLLKQAKAGDLSYGSAGNGSLQHLTMELLKKELAFPMVHVPYKGSSESKMAVIGNTLPITVDSLPAIYTNVKSGQMKAIAMIDDNRSAYLPAVPTLAEQGFPKLSSVAFFGLVAPKGTPREVVNALNSEIIAMYRTPAFQEKMKEQALTPPQERSPEQFDAYLAAEVRRWKKVVLDANVSAD